MYSVADFASGISGLRHELAQVSALHGVTNFADVENYFFSTIASTTTIIDQAFIFSTWTFSILESCPPPFAH